VMGRFPRLYAIVDRATLDARTPQRASSPGTPCGMKVGEFARELREGGVRLVQYRDKVNGSSTPANKFAGGPGPQEILRAANEIDEAFAQKFSAPTDLMRNELVQSRAQHAREEVYEHEADDDFEHCRQSHGVPRYVLPPPAFTSAAVAASAAGCPAGVKSLRPANAKLDGR